MFHANIKSIYGGKVSSNLNLLNSQKSEVSEKYILSYGSVLASQVVFVESRNFESGNV